MAETRDMQGKRWIARGLAGLALGASVLLVILVASGAIGGVDENDDSSEPEAGQTTEANRERGCPANPPADAALENGFYILKPGEPGLSAVQVRTCIPLDELAALNPELNPQAIPVGACINLRRDACAER